MSKKWDFGDLDNGIMLQKRKKNIIGEVVGDHSNHPTYNTLIYKKIDETFLDSKGNLKDAFDELESLTKSLIDKLSKEVIEGDKIVNNINIE